MTKKMLILFVLLFTLLLVACGGQTDSGDTGEELDHTVDCGEVEPGELADLGGQEIFMAVENAYPPFNYLDDSGVGIGWDYDMGRALCEMLNCEPVFMEAAWDGIFPAMAAGEYDVLFDGVTYLTERDETVDFSCAYVVIGQVLLVQAGEARFSSPEEFADNEDLVTSTQISTTNETVSHDLVGVDRTTSFEDFGLAVQALISGDVDAVVTDTVTALGFIGENPGQLEINSYITSDEQLALVFQPGSELVEAFTNALHQMAKDGSLEAMNDKWFNP
jgi:polar amino acid transport system substrate-binding protein